MSSDLNELYQQRHIVALDIAHSFDGLSCV